MFKFRNLALLVGLFLVIAAAIALQPSPAQALAPAGFTETPTSAPTQPPSTPTLIPPPTVLPPTTPTVIPGGIRPPRNRPPIGPDTLPVTGEGPGSSGLDGGMILGIALIAAVAGFAIGLGGKRFLAWLASRGIGGFLS